MDRRTIETQRNRLANIMERIVASYDGTSARIDRLDQRPLPSREEAARIMEALEEVIYPGYYRAGGVTHQGIFYRVQERIGWLFEQLRDQILKSLRHMKELDGELCDDCDSLAEEYTYAFLEAIPDLRKMLAKDIQAAYDGDPAAKSFDEIILSYPATYAITAYRAAHELHKLGVVLLPRMLTELAHARTGIDIHPGARIGESFFIDHGTGVVIGETTVIGNHVKLYQGVTLGALSFPKDEKGRLIRGVKRHPTLDDNVVIYAGATILGGETVIGETTVIGNHVKLYQGVTLGALSFPKDEKGRLIRGVKRHPTLDDNVVIYAGATILGGETVIGEGSIIGGNVWLTESVPPGTRVLQAEPKPRFVAAADQLQEA